MVTCATCGQESPDGFRFCGNCGSALLTDAGAGQAVRKTITVLFCDLVGSTALGERLDPESTQRVLGQHFQRVREVLERHQGTVEKYVGDAVVGVFGVPRLHEDDALRAVRAAAELGEALSELNKELERGSGVTLKIRVGLNTGEVVAGSAAAGSALVLGDAVNVAARLEQAAAPGEVLLGQTTWQLVRDAVTAEPVAPLALKGKAQGVAAWRLLGVSPDIPGHARRRDVPMVGREAERQLLLEAFDRVVAERACGLVTVLGAAGVGKTRLVDEALASVGERAVVLRGRCLSYGEDIAYWPVAEVVRQAAGISLDDTLQAAQGKLAALLAGQEQAELIASRIAASVGLAEAGGGTEETFWAIRQFLEHLGRGRPLVVVVDDLHWAEPTLLDLVEYLASFVRDAPMLLIGLARTELLDARSDWGGACRALARSCLSRSTAPSPAVWSSSCSAWPGSTSAPRRRLLRRPAVTRCSLRNWSPSSSTTGCSAAKVVAGWPARSWIGQVSRRLSRCCWPPAWSSYRPASGPCWSGPASSARVSRGRRWQPSPRSRTAPC